MYAGKIPSSSHSRAIQAYLKRVPDIQEESGGCSLAQLFRCAVCFAVDNDLRIRAFSSLELRLISNSVAKQVPHRPTCRLG